MVHHLATIAALTYILGTMSKKKRKKPWLERQRLRHSNIMSLLESEDLESFIDTEAFDQLLKLVRPYITKNDTIMNDSITAEERLIATLIFLSAGKGFQELKNCTLICPQLLAKIIPETCVAIYNALKSYLKFPKTKEDWKSLAQAFEQKWQFSNCVGSIDARHILIKKPSVPDCDTFLNHEGTHSIICVAAVNANYEFFFVETGFTGNFSSTYLPQYTKLIGGVINDELELPDSYPLQGTDKTVPPVFIGDGFWPLDTNIMTPYLGEELSESEKIFNYRLKRANTAENAFGVLYSNFQVFNEVLNLDFEGANNLVLATCALHNFLINKPCYFIQDMVDQEDTANSRYLWGDWRWTDPLMPVKRVRRKPWNCGTKVRNDLTEYFSTEGRLPLQEKMVDVIPREPIPSDDEVWDFKTVENTETK